MKIVIYFDLLESIMNVNEGITPMKIIRNEKRHWLKFNLPIYSIIDFSFNKPSIVPLVLGLQFGFIITADLMVLKMLGNDRYKDKSELQLKSLSFVLNKMNIDTNYELLKGSKSDGRNYKIRLNEKKIPQLVETKYILVPTNTAMGDIKDTSIEQEHVVGSKSYVLSLGSKKKKLVPAFSQT